MAMVLYEGKSIAFGSSREVFERVRASGPPAMPRSATPNPRPARRSVTAEQVQS
jgi:hypothetical protein